MLRLLLAMLATLLVTQAAIIATSVYLHRGLAHRALKLHPVADSLANLGALCRATSSA